VVQPGEVAGLRGEEERLGVVEAEDSPVAAGLPEVVADQEEASLLGVVAAVLLLGVEVDSGVVADLFCSCSGEPFTFFARYSGVITMLLCHIYGRGSVCPGIYRHLDYQIGAPPLRPNFTLVGTNPIAVLCSVRSRPFSSLPCTARKGVLHGRDRGSPYFFEVVLPFEGFSKEVLLSTPVLIIPKL